MIGILEYTFCLRSGQAGASELSLNILFQNVLQVNSGRLFSMWFVLCCELLNILADSCISVFTECNGGCQ